jgi:transposase
MAHFHTKMKKGRPYLYVREIARVNGKPTVVSQVYIGSPDRVAELASKKPSGDLQLSVQEFGSLFIANHMDSDVDFSGIVNSIVPAHPREQGPSVGDYFLFAVLNRMVEAKSKRALPDWYGSTAIQTIRPVDVKALDSERYWAKWDRVSPKQVEEIGKQFFAKIWETEKFSADCVLFDTTNYYTFMASDTKSELAMRGKSKEGRHNLRQIGLGLLVSRNNRLPLHYSVYPGNMHDSKLFGQIMDEMFGIVAGFQQTKERLTVVVDKGMNSETNMAWLDEHPRVHFVTTYSPYFATELAAVPIDQFEPVDTPKNLRLSEIGQDQERLVAYRTTGEFWGKKRTVVVTHTPATARKQEYVFDSKLEQIRVILIDMRAKVRDELPQWRDSESIRERYHRLCENLHVDSAYYELTFEVVKKRLVMSFRKNVYRVESKRKTFGRSIIITDNSDWTTQEIVQTNLDRWEVEAGFRQTKDDDFVGVRPIRHWTDSKIRCHLLTCVVALTYLRRLELRLQKKGISRTAASVMEELRQLHSVLLFESGSREPVRKLERPSKTQAEVLKAFGYRISESGVLQAED